MALGRAPSLEELATAVDVSVEEISRVMGEMNRTRVASLSQPLAGVEVNDMTLSDVVVAQWAESEPVVKEMAVAVSRAVGRLPENEQLLLRLIYVQHMTLRDIALVLQVTDSWVSHLHTRSMVLLQRALAAQY
jgi:RNA polymerase sigma factor for flagellar operon FliA